MADKYTENTIKNYNWCVKAYQLITTPKAASAM